jgi:tetratricopeptide (TPR) repeat protein
MKSTHLISQSSAIALLSTICCIYPKAVTAQIDIPQMSAETCAVLSGKQKPDSRTLQYLLLLEEDFADPNPVAIALYKQVIQQCPQAYLDYQQGKRASNPFANNPIVNTDSTPLSNLTNTEPNNTNTSQTNEQQEMAKYDEAIRLNPNEAKAYLARGTAYYDRKYYQEAIADYTEAIRLEPNNPLGYANRALAEQFLGNKQEAIADYQIAAKLFKAQGDQDNYQRVLKFLQELQGNSN